MMLNLEFDISNLRGAEYNPRKIDDDAIEALKESIRRFGLVKPLIVRGDLLVAGHQRTRALRALGITKAPVYSLPCETTLYDEIRFNQLHNGTDMDTGDEAASIAGGFDALGYQVVNPSRIGGNYRAIGAGIRTMICSMIGKYGPWGAVVATQSGEIFHCGQYALASGLVKSPLTVYVIEDERRDEYARLLGRQYGEFSYDGLKRDSYIQTFAQIIRLRKGVAPNSSCLYETMALPWMKEHPEAKCIDFGSGHGDYAKHLRDTGFDIDDLEFFRRVGNKKLIDVREINRMADQALKVIESGGYDCVVCDSVINSTDSKEAHDAVMCMLNILAKPGATIFMCGRKRERVEDLKKLTSQVEPGRYRRYFEFIDSDGWTALYREGRWFFQRYHGPEETEALIEPYGFQKVRHLRKQSAGYWHLEMVKGADIPLDRAIEAASFEFNLPLSDSGRRLGRHEDAIKAIRRKYGAI